MERNHLDYLKYNLCPKCGSNILQSEYLQSIFSNDQKTLWIANLVTHFRHNHTDWDDFWRENEEIDYYQEKKIYNEWAKRILISNGKEVLKSCGIGPEQFRNLQGTTDHTIYFANLYLSPPELKVKDNQSKAA